MNRIARMIGTLACCVAIAALPSVGSAQTLRRISVEPERVVGGATATGSIRLTKPAGTGGYTVTIVSSQAFATVPASVTVAAGDRSATFTVTTTAVTAKSDAAITGTGQDGKAETANFRVLPVELINLDLSPEKVTGGDSSTGTVTLNGPAPTGGVVITLLSNQAFATVPASVTVAAGATSATFTVATSDVTEDGHARITATDPSGDTDSARILVKAAEVVKIQHLRVDPKHLAGGDTATGTVELNAAAS